MGHKKEPPHFLGTQWPQCMMYIGIMIELQEVMAYRIAMEPVHPNLNFFLMCQQDDKSI